MGRRSDLTGRSSPLSTSQYILQYGEEFRGSLGHISLLGITRFVLPLTAGVRGTSYAQPVLDQTYLDSAHAQGGIAGFPHPYYAPPTTPARAASTLIPVDVALGKGDFYDVASLWSDELGSAEIYYRSLNCGFHLPATAGTDNFSDAWRDPPPGSDRTYVHVTQTLSAASWIAGIKAQRTFATTGPLLFLDVGGHQPGDEIALGASPPHATSATATRSRRPVRSRWCATDTDSHPPATRSFSLTPSRHWSPASRRPPPPWRTSAEHDAFWASLEKAKAVYEGIAAGNGGGPEPARH